MKCHLSCACPYSAECRAFKPKEIKNCPERNQIVKEMKFHSWQNINVSDEVLLSFFK
jgi:hypothetical protein